ncbi:MAG: urease accessory protein UreD [Pseudomonadota bacterium]|nr:urease accessory protein UreD [Pseudomonadota bacterium]
MIDVLDPSFAHVAASSGWHGELSLAFERRGSRTVLARRRHRGPLVVQKPLYPEGDAVCQNIVVHPPAGIVGGDRLTLDVTVDSGAHAQLTTPGAAKWYRSAGAPAQQRLTFAVGAHALLEWLPQESIVFDGAIAELQTRVALRDDAVFIGWEIVCLGRRLAGEEFRHGRLRQEVVVLRDDVRQWTERAFVGGGARLLNAQVGLNREPIFGTFLAAAPQVPEHLVALCRQVNCEDGESAVTRLPGLLLARYRGASAEAALHYFAALWGRARPALAKREAVTPRIWNT